MKDGAPDTKIVAVSAAGAVTTIIVWVVSFFYKVEIPADVAAALTTVIAAVAGYIAPYSAAVRQAIDEKIARSYEPVKAPDA